jgi:pantothenate kinase type III
MLHADIGTAATVDAVTETGSTSVGHRAGPGTDGAVVVAQRATAVKPQPVARAVRPVRGNTRAMPSSAAAAGNRHSSIAALTSWRTAGAQPVLLLTGGAASQLLPYVTTSAKVVPELVLQGLAILAGTTYA